jgi:hypothetical protein
VVLHVVEMVGEEKDEGEKNGKGTAATTPSEGVLQHLGIDWH